MFIQSIICAMENSEIDDILVSTAKQWYIAQQRAVKGNEINKDIPTCWLVNHDDIMTYHRELLDRLKDEVIPEYGGNGYLEILDTAKVVAVRKIDNIEGKDMTNIIKLKDNQSNTVGNIKNKPSDNKVKQENNTDGWL